MKMILLVLLFLKMSAMCSALPMMKVSGIEKDGVTRLTCLVYGFYPKNVTVKWVKNGIDNIFENQPDQTLLLPDETYQTTLSIDVQIKQFDTYACHMDHSSLLETVIVLWGYKSKALPHYIAPDDSPNVGLIVGLVVLVFISVCVLGLIIWKKCPGKRMNREGLNRYTYVFCFRGMRIISPRH